LVALQLDAFRRAWRQVPVGTRRPYDVLTVASMVERETVAPEERRLVAAVI
jgi:cell division protein YceG involved in septum cleavage